MPAEYDLIGPWSEVKLEILRDCAGPYSKILVANGFRHHYIDGFAGPGSHVSRATGEPVPGSPLNARTQPPFREYHFIDLLTLIPLGPGNWPLMPMERQMFTYIPVTATRYF